MTTHPVFVDWLDRVREQARDLPRERADELVADLTEHLVVAEQAGPLDDASARQVVERLGRPAEVVAAVRREFGVPAAPPAAPQRLGGSEVAGLTCLVLSVFFFALPVIGIVLLAVGIILIARSTRWTIRQRLAAILTLAPLAPVSLWAMFMPFGSTAQSCEGGQNPDGTTWERCTGGDPGWLEPLVQGLMVAWLVLAVGVVVWLLRALRRR